jgi:glycosyltransferase involved in cell wall biosynthesis
MDISGALAVHTCSVVICAFTLERWSNLLAAIQSVQAQTAAPDEILLVIDHNEGLATKAEAELRGISVLRNAGPQGLSSARNTALRAAKGTIVAFLDDDAVASPTWLEHLTRWYENDTVLAVGGAIQPEWQRARPAWFPSEFLWVVGCTYRGMPVEATSVRNVIGANMSFRRGVLDRLGGFNVAMGRVGANQMGCEETEACIKALHLNPGASVIYDPEASVSHFVLPGRERFSYFLRRCYAEGRSKYALRRVVGKQALASETVYVIRTLARSFWRDAIQAVTHLDPSSGLRAAACVSGLSSTALGYIRAMLRIA